MIYHACARVDALDTVFVRTYTQIAKGLRRPVVSKRPGGVAVNILACQAKDRRFESDPGRQ